MIYRVFLLAVTTFSRLAGSVVVFFILAKYYSVEMFGLFMYLFVFATIFTLVADYGFRVQIIKEMKGGRGNSWRIVESFLTAKHILSLSVLILALIVLWVYLENYFQFILFAVLLLSLIAHSYTLFFYYPLRALDRFEKESKASVIANISLFVFVGICVLLDGGLIAVSLIFLTIRMFTALVAWKELRQCIGCRFFGSNIRFGVKRLKTGFPYGVHVAVGVIYFNIDTLLIEYYLGKEEVGVYQAGIRIIVGLQLAADVIVNSFLTILARKRHDFSIYYESSGDLVRYLLLIGALLSLMLTMFGSDMVTLLGEDDYSDLVYYLPFMSIILVIRFYGAGVGLLLTLEDMQYYRVLSVCVALLIGIIANILFLEKYGLSAVVLVSIGTHLILTFMYYYFLPRQIKNRVFTYGELLLVLILIVHYLGVFVFNAWESGVAYFTVLIYTIIALSVKSKDVMYLKKMVFREEKQ